MALTSAGDGDGRRRSRWTILTEPSERSLVVGAGGLDELDGALRGTRVAAGSRLPFVGGWVGWFAYELGGLIEPTTGLVAGDSALAHLAWCPAALLFDHAEGRWWGAGEERGVDALLDAMGGTPVEEGAWASGALLSEMGREGYCRAVARAVELIHAGDVFQVNLAHRMSAPFEGPARALFLRLLATASPDHGALLELGGPSPAAVVSISPELFVEADFGEGSGRRVTTRPIKGTRASAPGARSALRGSAKDEAELVMIVDLMRNDLGRVCEPGSVRVDSARDIESHAGGGLLHAAATVSGALRPGAGPAELLGAAFPPGSVTGAPKVRAMQIIRELEGSARGVYCGAIGYFSDHGPGMLSVAIRTATITGQAHAGESGAVRGRLTYPVGAGIVADSEPEAEWQETLDKAGAMSAALEAGRAPAGVSGS